MSDELKTIKFQLMLSPSEAEAIDDWGFKNRIRTRAEAIRRLCQIALLFDENRMDLVSDQAEIANKSADLTERVRGLVNDEDVSPKNASFLIGTLDLIASVSKAWPRFRLVTGMAKNIKSIEEMDDVLLDVDDMNKLQKELESVRKKS